MAMVNPLLSRLAAQSAAATSIRIGIRGPERALPQSALYEVLYHYYYSNGLYDQLQLAGYWDNDIRLKGLRNPAKRIVEFYADTVWPGPLAQALPLDDPGQRLAPFINKIWSWSNWAQQRQILVRKTATLGDGWIKVAQPRSGAGRVYLQVLEPSHVTHWEADERDYITAVRVDVPGIGADGSPSYYTEIWDQETVQVWAESKGPTAGLGKLGPPDKATQIAVWGLDFPPFVHIKHKAVGGPHGVGAYTLDLDKITEADLLATRLHKMLFRHNDVTWALRANGTDATGRPLPPPSIAGGSASGESGEVVDMAGEKMIRLPGTSVLDSLVPKLDYGAQLAALNDHMGAMAQDLPELEYYKLKDLPEVSGKALRIMLKPAIARGLEARGNYEEGLIRAHKMALTIGSQLAAWGDLGDPGLYEAGDYDHSFMPRNLIPLTREDIAELAAAETAAGIPLATSLRNSGWTQDQLAALEEDQTAAQLRTQTALGAAMLAAREASGGSDLEDPDL